MVQALGANAAAAANLIAQLFNNVPDTLAGVQQVFSNINAAITQYGATAQALSFSGIETKIVNAAQTMLQNAATQAVANLVAKFIPGVGALNSLMNGFTFLATNYNQIADIVLDIVNSVKALVSGVPEAAATFAAGLVTAMNKSIPLLLAFGVSQLGLANLPNQIKSTLQAIPNTIQKQLMAIVSAIAKKVPLSGLGGTNSGLFAGELAPMVQITYQGVTYDLWTAKDGRNAVVKIAYDNNGSPIFIAALTAANFTGNSVGAFNTLKADAQAQVNVLSGVAPLATTANQARPNQQNLAAQQSNVTKIVSDQNLIIPAVQAGDCGLLTGCLAAGTRMRTPTGLRSIEEIARGELVFARNELDPNGIVEAKVVEEVFERFAEIVEINAEGAVIRTTGEHLYYRRDPVAAYNNDDESGKWSKVSDLRPGQFLFTDNFGWKEIKDVRGTGKWERVYNLRVADHHTYFIGDATWGFGIWAYNAYLGRSNPTVRILGNNFATLASGWWGTLPEGNRLGATVAVTEVGNKKYVALYANIGNGGQQFTQTMVDQFIASAREAGWIPIVTKGTIHAEMALYSAVPNAPVIGISNPSGPCDSVCQQFFTQRNYYNIVWPGAIRASWGNN